MLSGASSLVRSKCQLCHQRPPIARVALDKSTHRMHIRPAFDSVMRKHRRSLAAPLAPMPCQVCQVHGRSHGFNLKSGDLAAENDSPALLTSGDGATLSTRSTE